MPKYERGKAQKQGKAESISRIADCKSAAGISGVALGLPRTHVYIYRSVCMCVYLQWMDTAVGLLQKKSRRRERGPPLQIDGSDGWRFTGGDFF
jgi:hypothetical protein